MSDLSCDSPRNVGGNQWVSSTSDFRKQMFLCGRKGDALMQGGRSISHPSSGDCSLDKALIPEEHLRNSDCCFLVISSY